MTHSLPPLPRPRTLVTEEELDSAIAEVGRRIAEQVDGRRVIMVPILKGALCFASRLIAHLPRLPLEVEPVIVTSYEKTESTLAQTDLLRLTALSLKGSHILLVDDIFDTGQTLYRITKEIEQLSPASITHAVMLEKTGCQSPDFPLQPEYIAAHIAPEFVVGVGLDYRGFYRNLPYIGVLGDAEQSYVDRILDP